MLRLLAMNDEMREVWEWYESARESMPEHMRHPMYLVIHAEHAARTPGKPWTFPPKQLRRYFADVKATTDTLTRLLAETRFDPSNTDQRHSLLSEIAQWATTEIAREDIAPYFYRQAEVGRPAEATAPSLRFMRTLYSRYISHDVILPSRELASITNAALSLPDTAMVSQETAERAMHRWRSESAATRRQFERIEDERLDRTLFESLKNNDRDTR